MTYGEAVSVAEMSERDDVVPYDDVELPSGRLADRLRAEQYAHFRGKTWLAELIGMDVAAPAIT